MKLLTFIHNQSEICTGGHHNEKILSEAYVPQGSPSLTRIQILPREQLRTMLSKSMRSIQRLAAGKQSLFRAGSNFSTNSLTIDLGEVFSTHLCEAPSTTVTVTKDELLAFFKEMYTMRRVEISNDTEYKGKNIRGFCHLYDGQEAVASGMQAALKKEDSWITSYRCHCVALLRGSTPEQIFAELFGFSHGTSKGKGGSMHFYSKENNFFGGQGIVGAQVPVGAGLAFAAKYNTKPGEKMPIAIACYGDGAANQGQIWESANMCKLWDLPMVFVIENNHYGMGTSTGRSSCNNEYYTMGGRTIPGIKINGMNVLAVKQGFAMVREHCSSGKGPMYVEFDTYRYHGHSMSDPGDTYRTRNAVDSVRQLRDPIEYVKKLLIDNNLSTVEEIKVVEKGIRNSVQDSLLAAKKGSFAPDDWVYREIHSTPEMKDEPIKYIRMPDIQKSIHN